MENLAVQDRQPAHSPSQVSGRLELAELIGRHALTDGIYPTAIPSLHLFRVSTPTVPGHTIQEPSLCLVAQGSKILTLGSERFTYDPDHFLMVSVGLPVAARIVEVSPERPYLGLRIELDTTVIAELIH